MLTRCSGTSSRRWASRGAQESSEEETEEGLCVGDGREAVEAEATAWPQLSGWVALASLQKATGPEALHSVERELYKCEISCGESSLCV